MNKIKQALTKIFDRHRIVFWYDAKQELRGDYEAVDLPDVEKIELNNNEFGVKYRILREQPDHKFLLYHEGPQPADPDNWLLDVQLAYGEFRTDQVAIWLSEMDLGPEFADVVRDHVEFFNAVKRREALKKLIRPDDTPGLIRTRMLAVCSCAEPRMDEIVECLLAELAEEREEKIKLLQRCNLESFLWEQLKRCYGYESESPGIHDFAIELFKSCYAMGLGQAARLTGDALVFLKRWQDSIRRQKSFKRLSTDCAESLGIEQDLQQHDFRLLMEMDYFQMIDRKILSDLVRCAADRTLSAADCAALIRTRRQSHWYPDFQHLYEAVDYAARFMHALDESDLKVDSMSEGIRRYAHSWYRLDQLYRKFIFHARRSGQTSLLEQLSTQVENLYANNYLLRVNNDWQQVVDACQKWDAPPHPLQRRFYGKWVEPFLTNRKKVFVIISDALRFEVGEELLGLIRQEDRYEADIEPMLAMLPSYTQLGMAALLPNKALRITDDESATVMVDGISSQGTANRARILDQAIAGKAAAVRAEELLGLNKEACRALIRDHDVVYVYHNRIDATGDKKESEERVFEAAEETLQELLRIIKKLAAANATNLIVTADHGFIYQNRAIDESDFSGAQANGQHICYRDRRFLLGTGLDIHPALRRFQADEIGLAGAMEVQIPKSINRLRLKGSGSRYVHGGASLQEIVLPVIRIRKKRRSDVTTVAVDILGSASSIITSGQLTVTFYQVRPVTEKTQPRQLRAGIYTQSGELISDSHHLTFDLTSENPREREIPVRFLLTRKADEANDQDVILRLEEPISGTSHYQEYKSVRYVMRRAFTSDFDF